MEVKPQQPTDEQLARRASADQLQRDVENGTITSPDQLDPRTTSPEAVLQARIRLRQLGRVAQENT